MKNLMTQRAQRFQVRFFKITVVVIAVVNFLILRGAPATTLAGVVVPL